MIDGGVSASVLADGFSRWINRVLRTVGAETDRGD